MHKDIKDIYEEGFFDGEKVSVSDNMTTNSKTNMAEPGKNCWQGGICQSFAVL